LIHVSHIQVHTRTAQREREREMWLASFKLLIGPHVWKGTAKYAIPEKGDQETCDFVFLFYQKDDK
jgi:hypothetical protein